MLKSFEIGSKTGRFLICKPFGIKSNAILLYSLQNSCNGVDIVRTFVIEYPIS